MLGMADQIAEQYLTRVKIKSDFISAACPFHKEGQERHPSFWVSRSKGNWGCFTCEARGSGLRWLLKELGIRSATIDAQLKEAEKHAERFRELDKVRTRKKSRKAFKGDFILPDALLGVYEWLPVDLVEDGFDPAILRQHDVGFDRKKNRITWPIRDLYGNLVGISGRATLIGEQPKYLVYNGRRIIDGKEDLGELGEWYPEYSNDGVRDHLWRLDKCWSRLMDDIDGQEQLILVEGYKAALWLVQHNWLNTVALMGARMSPAQERIIRKLGVPVFVFLDNNKPGRRGSTLVCRKLVVSSFPVFEVSYPEYLGDNAQPDDLNESELDEALCKAVRKVEGRHVAKLRRLG
jgi:DNA primase